MLGGVISPIDGIGPEQLHVPELISQLAIDNVEEVIIATNASVEGESTALYLQKAINESSYKGKNYTLGQGYPSPVLI